MIVSQKKKHLVAEGAELNNRQLEIVEEKVKLDSGEKGWCYRVKGWTEGIFITQEDLDSGALSAKDAYDKLAQQYEHLADPI